MQRIDILMKPLIRWMITAAFWLGLWQLTYLTVAKEFIVPSPLHTVESLAEMVRTHEFYRSVSATMGRVVSGMAASFLCGCISAIVGYGFSFARQQLHVIVAVVKSTPVLAIVLYLILWMPSAQVPMFVCFLVCYPVVYTNVLAGLDAIQPEYLEMAQVFRIGYADRVTQLYLPAVKPQIKAALSLIAGLSWKTVVAGEVLSIPKYSMGYHLMEAKLYFETAELLAWVAAIIILSIAFERLIGSVVSWL